MLKLKLTKKAWAIIILSVSVGFGILAFVFRGKMVYLQNLGYLGIFVANLIGSASIFLPVPTLLTVIAAGAFLNPLLVGILAAIGATIGELTGYYAGVGGEEFVKDNKNIQKVERWMDKYGLWVVFVLAAIPNPFFDLAGIISGAAGLSIKKYLIAVFFGKLIKFVVLAYLGRSLIAIFPFVP
jgi:uncharacterized membrane protein YdjX (TVP38/TMEM64 family)